MKMCTDTITVFNKHLNTTDGWDEYIPTVISGVSWYCEIVSAVDNSGLHAANRFTVRIPTTAKVKRKYVDPATYISMSDVSKAFTLASGDIVVKAKITSGGLTPAQLKDQFADCFVILGVTDNRRAPNAPHFKVVGS